MEKRCREVETIKFLPKIFLIIIVALFSGSAFAAGYSCPAYMKYTSCSAGYYMTVGGSYNGTPVAGNACTACPSGYGCAGGTAGAVPLCSSDCTYNATRAASCGGISNGTYNGTQTCNATKNGVSGCYTWGATTGCTVNCNAGFVPNGASCENCGNNVYCNSNTRYSCPANNQDLASLSGGTILSQTQGWTSGQPNATAIADCRGDTEINVGGGTYLAECPWDGTNYYNGCGGGYLWYAADTGYYLTGYISTSYRAWYRGVTACSNKPGNSYYTGPGSPDTNNCAWSCNGGYQKTPSNTCIECPSGYSVNSSGQCQISVPAGSYIATAKSATLSTCAGGTAKAAHTVIYGATSACASCTGATYSSAGASSCTACPGIPGNTLTTGDEAVSASANASSVTQCYLHHAARWENHGYWTHENGGYNSDSPCYWDGNDYKICSKTYWACETGYYISSVNPPSGFTNSCVPCYIGTYDSTESWNYQLHGGGYTPMYNGAHSCSLCADGTYQDMTAQSSCKSCPSGLSSPAGSDEAGDCGRKLHIGSDTLYLRSAKKTTPSLNISINGTTYYGNMGTASKGKLRINSAGTTYSVYDDSM